MLWQLWDSADMSIFLGLRMFYLKLSLSVEGAVIITSSILGLILYPDSQRSRRDHSLSSFFQPFQQLYSQITLCNKTFSGASLVVKIVKTAHPLQECMASIPGWGNNILHAVWYGISRLFYILLTETNYRDYYLGV